MRARIRLYGGAFKAECEDSLPVPATERFALTPPCLTGMGPGLQQLECSVQDADGAWSGKRYIFLYRLAP